MIMSKTYKRNKQKIMIKLTNNNNKLNNKTRKINKRKLMENIKLKDKNN